VPDCEIVRASDSVDTETYCGRRLLDAAADRAGILMETATTPLLFDVAAITGGCWPALPPPPLQAASRAESDVSESSARVHDIVKPFIDGHAIE
jgi:hypothetical protein